MVLVVDSDFDDEDSVDVGGEGLEVELCDIFYFEDDVGGEVIAPVSYTHLTLPTIYSV